jgi:signal peptidase I
VPSDRRCCRLVATTASLPSVGVAEVETLADEPHPAGAAVRHGRHSSDRPDSRAITAEIEPVPPVPASYSWAEPAVTPPPTLPAGPAADPGPADVLAQIQARVAERKTVASSFGDPVVRRKAGKASKGDDAVPRHRRPHRAAALRQLVVFGLVTALIVFGLRTFVVASFYIPSASMETTLHGCPGCEPDLVMVDKLSYRFGHPSRGDVIVFDKPAGVESEDNQLIKRVIGLPGETISGHDGKVWIGGRPLDEPYVNKACADPGSFAPVSIPAGRFFMMGDNRCDSSDSRVFGTISGKTMVGRAFAVVWPFKHLRWL